MELAVENRMKRPVSATPKSRPGVTARWARRMISNDASQLSATPNWRHNAVQSAQA
jgi:hypothetical protein